MSIPALSSTSFAGEDAPAKVNLFLHVTGRRADGYHELDSLAVFAGIGDVLTAAADEGLSLTVSGPFAAGLAAEPDNLVLRAARALAQEAGVVPRAKLDLRKNLPVASGIGGGSADAAAALRLLCRLWGVAPGQPALHAIALRLGADVPVCLSSRPMRMSGVGEVLSPAPALPACGLALINPGFSVATPAVFRARTGSFSAPADLPDRLPDVASLVEAMSGLRNDLEPPAVALKPMISAVLAALRADTACRLARMSGSGATCFGLFNSPADAAAAAGRLERPGWWSWGGGLAGNTL